MKNTFLIFSLIFLLCSPVFAVPGFDKEHNTPTYYDVSYNVTLRNKLEADFDKKYATCNNKGCYYNAPLEAYENEVLAPYDRQKKPDNYKIINK